MRLAKYLAHAGVASRRGAERLIAEGRVRVGGAVVLDPAQDVSEGTPVSVDGNPVAGSETRLAYVLNKPVGVISTAQDTHGRRTVVELLGETGARLYPVGRLDADSSGLIVLTNDGELANRLTHPRYEVAKTYRVRLAGGEVSREGLRALREGVMLADGLTAPAEVRRLRGIGPGRELAGRALPGRALPGGALPGGALAGRERRDRGRPDRGRPDRGRPGRGGPAEDLLEITIREGRNRQIRRMCESVGHPVLELERVAMGPLRLGELAPGEHRRLSEEELARLRGLGLRQSPA